MEHQSSALSRSAVDGARSWAASSENGVPGAEISGSIDLGQGCLAGRYRLIDRLGDGGVGEVFLARDLEAGGDVALKLFPAYGTSPAVTPERVRAEARLNRSVRHVNVVQLLDLGHTDAGLPFVVTEALQGETLGQKLRRCHRLPVDEALRIVRQAALGLRAVHRAGVVHCDVKPDNLFLCDEERHGVLVKVLDFGFALESCFESSGESQVFGTLAYIAPEQALAERVDGRADIYSLGVVLFRALTGELPFDGCSRHGLLAHHLVSAVPPPSWLREDLGENIDRLVGGAVRKHPDNRYASIDGFVADLDRVARGEAAAGVSARVEPDEYVPVTDDGRRVRSALGR